VAAVTAATPAAGRVLAVNAWSSSLKLRVLDQADTVTGRVGLPAPRDTAIAIESLGPVDAVGQSR
jgi:hypothetical protein